MLVITRKKGESLLIGDDIEITISKIDDGSVKIAIDAPREIRILRKELYTEVQNENIEATKIDLNVLKNFKK
ncbi:MAG: carbon storage regulator CsrA [Clostridium sp.]